MYENVLKLWEYCFLAGMDLLSDSLFKVEGVQDVLCVMSPSHRRTPVLDRCGNKGVVYLRVSSELLLCSCCVRALSPQCVCVCVRPRVRAQQAVPAEGSHLLGERRLHPRWSSCRPAHWLMKHTHTYIHKLQSGRAFKMPLRTSEARLLMNKHPAP